MAKQYTKNLIKREFINLLTEESFSSITIAMIAESCEINRNTFYYHYEDIYALVKEILDDEIRKVDEEFNSSFSWEKSTLHAVSFLLDNKKACQNLFRSISKKEIDSYLYKVCESVMSKYIDNECELKSINPIESDKILVRNFYRSALVGLLDKWIQDGMEEDAQKLIFRIGKLFDGNIERSLRISEELKNENPFSH